MKIHVPLPAERGRDASYDILIDRGILQRIPALLAQYCPATAYAVISDSNVGPRYGESVVGSLRQVGQTAQLFTFPAGEASKTRETWAALCDRLLDARVGRDGAVIALGGGVVGDVAGFVAATYLRGVPYVQVPTSLLAMIDASIGGKTGVDVPQGKNLLGAFHQPRVVLVDLDALATLPATELANAMAEAVKHGVIADAAYLGALEREGARVLGRDPATLERVVTRSVEIKGAIVAEDERETGRRAILNFGHTIGHAIEATSGFGIAHGAAVAIGMVLEARVAERAGIAAPGTGAHIARALSSYALPAALPAACTVDEVVASMQLDKKVRDGKIRFAVPRCVGEMAGGPETGWTMSVADTLMREVLSSRGSA